MNPSVILPSLLLSLSAGVLASTAGESNGTEKAFNVEKTLRGFDKPHPSHGMILLSGPVSKEGSEINPFAAFFRHKRHHRNRARHHRRHRIHRHPVVFMAPNGIMEEHPAAHPNALLEVMKIRERVVVDEQNHPKSAELALTNDLMQIDPVSGQVKMLRHGEIHIKPKTEESPASLESPKEQLRTGAGLLKSVGPERTFVVTEFGADGQPIKMPQEGSRLDRFIRYLHLDQFWPLFFFSAACGFTFVGLTFLTAKLILGFIDDNERESYEPVPTGENLLSSIESAQPIKITNEMIEVNEKTSLNNQDNDADV